MEYIKNYYNDTRKQIKALKPREVIFQMVNLVLIVSSALVIWRGLMVLTGTESPIVVVLSGSMEPAYSRGDLLFLIKPSAPLVAGDVVVYKIDDREIPIVHRIMRVHKSRVDGTVRILTKGDNNTVDDRNLYPPPQEWLEERHIIGKTYGFLPYIGIVTILMNDYPFLKVLLLAIMGLIVITTKE